MRHRRKGRKLGRSPAHQRALLRSLATALILTERDAEHDDNKPKVKGRIITTLEKAKEVRPVVEKAITLACRAIEETREAEQYATTAERNTDAWKKWRHSEQWSKWAKAVAPLVDARRRALVMLGDKQAVRILFAEVAPRFIGRNGGYTRVLRLAKPRLGDNGTRAILEFVGVRDRVTERAQKPTFEAQSAGSK
jgi:large subunit ribosomal protein L17